MRSIFIVSILLLNVSSFKAKSSTRFRFEVFVPKFWQALSLSVQAVLVSPTILFFTLLLSKNKIDGVTLIKVMNVSIMLPIIAIVDASWRYVFAVFPAFFL